MVKVKCQGKIKSKEEKVRVRIVKAPLVNTQELEKVIFARTKALVL